MLLIAHRGNTHGPDPKLENKPTYVDAALQKGYEVEIDVWYEKSWWLGHDKPQHKVTFNWLVNHSSKLWVHAKDIPTMYKLSKRDGKNIWNHNLNYFWHQNDDCTLTNHNWIWTFPKKQLTKRSICVMPESAFYTDNELWNCGGICSNHIVDYTL